MIDSRYIEVFSLNLSFIQEETEAQNSCDLSIIPHVVKGIMRPEPRFHDAQSGCVQIYNAWYINIPTFMMKYYYNMSDIFSNYNEKLIC